MSDIGYDIWAGTESGNIMTSQQENELIAEKLLGWKRIPPPHGVVCWDKGDDHTGLTPTFTDWQDRGLIIDALQKAWPLSKDALRDIGSTILMGALTEQDVRNIALSYLRARELPQRTERNTGAPDNNRDSRSGL